MVLKETTASRGKISGAKANKTSYQISVAALVWYLPDDPSEKRRERDNKKSVLLESLSKEKKREKSSKKTLL